MSENDALPQVTKLSTMAIDDCHDSLKSVVTEKAAKCLKNALAYEDGIAVEILRERYGISQAVYYWMGNFEEMIEKTMEDDDRLGQPSPFIAED